MIQGTWTKPDHYYINCYDGGTGDSNTTWTVWTCATADPVDDYVPPTAAEIREAVKRGWISDSVAALRMALAVLPKRIRDQSSDRGIGCLNFRRAP